MQDISENRNNESGTVVALEHHVRAPGAWNVIAAMKAGLAETRQHGGVARVGAAEVRPQKPTATLPPEAVPAPAPDHRPITTRRGLASPGLTPRRTKSQRPGLAELLACRRSSITVMAAVMFPVIIGMAGLVTEYGDGLLVRQRAQRAADLLAYTGAVAYTSAGTTAAMTAAVSRGALLNGYSGSSVSAQLVASPSGDGNQAVLATVTSSIPLGFSTIVSANAKSLGVTATGYVELKGGYAACIIALNTSGSGITLSGGSALTASSCTVASNNTVVVPNGTSITTTKLDYNSADPPSSNSLGNIHAPSGGTLTISQVVTADPIANNSSMSAAVDHLTAISSMTSPSPPSVSSGTSIDFTSYPTTTFSAGGCTFTYANSRWTGSCSGQGPFNFGSVMVGGGVSVAFNTGGSNWSSAATYNFSGPVTNDGSSLTFGPGTYNMAKGLVTGGGSTTSFGAGTFNIGSATSCGSGGWSIQHSGTALSFAGPSTFTISCGVYNDGGSSTVALGSGGTTNSYQIGYTTTGGVNIGVQNTGGSTTTFGDATGGLFQVNGELNLGAGGGSCITLPASSAHDINGNMYTAGGVFLGSGVYSINGYAAFGPNGGGDVTCGGTLVGVSGNGVTLVLSGLNTISSGNCGSTAVVLCVANGYGHVTLTAPASGTTSGFVVIGPKSGTGITAGAAFTEGSTNTTLSGVFYMPTGPITLSGAASVGNVTGQCLELIGSQITQSGGTSLASTCAGVGGQDRGGQLVLVQ
jgi:hypothetical protein